MRMMRKMNQHVVRNMRGAAAIVAIAMAASSMAGISTASAAEGIAGSWSGSGSVTLPSGAVEKARCKVSFRKQGAKTYGMNAVCASSSARAEQTATLEQVGASRYAGDFTNAEYGVSGSINIVVNGSSMSASLEGGGGSAFFHLSR